MRYLASEKLEIIRLVEQSHLPARKTLEKLGVSRASFYRWCDLYQSGGLEALADKPSRPSRVWNRIPKEKRDEIVQLALDEPELSPRERECLLWIAEGKTYWETAMILGLSEHTVRCYLESARHKLGAANNTHAVNKAGKASLLTSLP